jgi:hypothetical protein
MLFAALGHGAIGFSPFGIDDNGRAGVTEEQNAARLAPFAANYAALTPMMREVARWSFEGKLKAAVEHDDHAAQTLDLGVWQATVTFGTGGRNVTPNTRAVGQVLAAQLGENEFVFVGSGAKLTFKPAGPLAGKAWHFLKVEEGNYENGKFKALRIWNGDETDYGGPNLGAGPVVLHVTLYTR